MGSEERRRTLRPTDSSRDCDLRQEVKFSEQRRRAPGSDEYRLRTGRHAAGSQDRRVTAARRRFPAARAAGSGYFISKDSWTSGTSAAPRVSSPSSSSSSRLDHPLTPYFAHIFSKNRASPSRYFSPA